MLRNEQGIFTPSLPEPPGGLLRQTQEPLIYRQENKYLHGEQAEGGLFLSVLLRVHIYSSSAFSSETMLCF